MKQLIIDEGLLLTDMEMTYKGNTLQLARALIDTGSMSTIISADNAGKIGIVAEEEDIIYRISGIGGSELVYTKMIDSIQVGHCKTVNFAIEIGAMDYGVDLDAIIGLDLLQRIRAMINIEKLSLQWHI